MILSSNILGSGPVLIILHGLFGEGKNWLTIGKVLSKNYEVHLIDQRNHGNSFHHVDHNYQVMSEDLVSYLDLHQINSCSIIGHSMGGKVAMNFTFNFPDKVNKLIIVDISPKKYRDQFTEIFSGLKMVLRDAKSRKDAITILMNYVHDLNTAHFLLKSLFINNTGSPSLKFNLNVLEKNRNILLEELNPKGVYNGLTYFLHGEKSNYINFSDISHIKMRFPNSKLIKIKDAGHWIHFDQKNQFLLTIEKILG